MIKMMNGRDWPLTPMDIETLESEWDRIVALGELLKKRTEDQPETLKRLLQQDRGVCAFHDALKVIQRKGPYDEETRRDFAEALVNLEAALECKLGISESERMSILKAFTNMGVNPIGRWFKCPNGHVYVVTECGGVTEEGNCNECGATVGGQNHRILLTNDLASEMDGSLKPLYPTAIQYSQ